MLDAAVEAEWPAALVLPGAHPGQQQLRVALQESGTAAVADDILIKQVVASRPSSRRSPVGGRGDKVI
jgi:hypothetical protein